jgi:hypothetical protein
MFALDSTAHGLVDPTPTATISLCALSAMLFLLFFIPTGYNYQAPGAAVFFFVPGHGPATGEAALVYFASAVLGASLGLIASVVRYRHPIRSTFTVVTAGPFLGIVLYLLGLSIPPAFASPACYGHMIAVILFWTFVNFCILSVAFSSCAVGGCIAGHIIQERSKRWVASPTLPSLVTLAVGMISCAAVLATTFWLGQVQVTLAQSGLAANHDVWKSEFSFPLLEPAG